MSISGTTAQITPATERNVRNTEDGDRAVDIEEHFAVGFLHHDVGGRLEAGVTRRSQEFHLVASASPG